MATIAARKKSHTLGIVGLDEQEGHQKFYIIPFSILLESA
jgi:hypothetical protein